MALGELCGACLEVLDGSCRCASTTLGGQVDCGGGIGLEGFLEELFGQRFIPRAQLGTAPNRSSAIDAPDELYIWDLPDGVDPHVSS